MFPMRKRSAVLLPVAVLVPGSLRLLDNRDGAAVQHAPNGPHVREHAQLR